MVVEAVFAVIAEGTRRDILEALASGHKAVGQLVEELGVSQPTVSKHLRVLREAGVVTMRAQGQKRFYSINTQPLSLVSEWLHGLGAGLTPLVRPLGESADAAGNGSRSGTPSGTPSASDSAASVNHSAFVAPAVPPAAGAGSAPGPAAAAPVAANRPDATAAALPPAEAGHTVAASTPAAVLAAPLPEVTAALHPVGEGDTSVQQQITRSMGRAANRAADLLANLPTFRRRKD